MDAEKFTKKNKLLAGRGIKVTKNNEHYSGILLPSPENSENLHLKLSSGYNIGVKIEGKIKIEKLPESKKIGKAQKKEISQNNSLPKISILHTGGTIATRVDYRTGAAFSSFDPQDLLSMFPELSQIGNFSSKLLANMWSDDLRFEHIALIAKEVKNAHEKGASGIIIGMGTDNLAVGSAALAFTLEECPIPVIFVGAQRSSDRPSSDAGMNLICAAKFIAKTDFAGVAICMHNSSSDDKCAILPACKTRKMHSSERGAFKAINDIPIALVDFSVEKIEFLKKDYSRRSEQKIILKPKFENKVALFKIHINMHPDQFEFYSKNKYKGVVIEGTGLGHTPGHNPNQFTKIHEKFFPALKKLISSGCTVVMTTNTIHGRVQMHVYDKGADLTKLGVISGEDMLPETAFVKLSWLLGNYKPAEAKELIGKNLRGEISEFTKYT
ncbi:MAG TPA: Glu-tRNA(Gln) amidotransferase subunit GatD [archaeon]|nr:Glu-tRNA(Gln) amidotransferase subunit GatD [archaeon]